MTIKLIYFLLLLHFDTRKILVHCKTLIAIIKASVLAVLEVCSQNLKQILHTSIQI